MTIGYSLLTILYVKIDKNVRGKQPQVAVNIFRFSTCDRLLR